MKKLFNLMALTLILVLMPSFVRASEKKLFSNEEAKEMGFIAPNDSVYDRMYYLAVNCIGADYEYARFDHLANEHKEWETDILDDCASYRTVMEVCRFYVEQPVFWVTFKDDEWYNEIQTLIDYWVLHDPNDAIMQEYAKFD